jgi:hypothetical protein
MVWTPTPSLPLSCASGCRLTRGTMTIHYSDGRSRTVCIDTVNASRLYRPFLISLRSLHRLLDPRTPPPQAGTARIAVLPALELSRIPRCVSKIRMGEIRSDKRIYHNEDTAWSSSRALSYIYSIGKDVRTARRTRRLCLRCKLNRWALPKCRYCLLDWC